MTHPRTWSGCPRERSLGVERSQAASGGFFSAATLHARRRSCRASALHVCAFAYHTNSVLVSCGARVPASGLGAVPKTCSFLVCGREYSGEYVSTSTSTYVRSQRTAVFWHDPNQLVGTLAPCNAPTPIPIGRYANAQTCTESAKVRPGTMPSMPPSPANQLQTRCKYSGTLGRN